MRARRSIAPSRSPTPPPKRRTSAKSSIDWSEDHDSSPKKPTLRRRRGPRDREKTPAVVVIARRLGRQKTYAHGNRCVAREKPRRPRLVGAIDHGRIRAVAWFAPARWSARR